jgi:hypothetical protein
VEQDFRAFAGKADRVFRDSSLISMRHTRQSEQFSAFLDASRPDLRTKIRVNMRHGFF